MISSRTTSDEMGHNPQAPGPARKQAFLLKEKPWKKLRLTTDDLIGVYAKPESCEETIDVCLACRINGLFRTQFMDKRNSAMLVRMTEC